jgi:hypothetical protein
MMQSEVRRVVGEEDADGNLPSQGRAKKPKLSPKQVGFCDANHSDYWLIFISI